MYEARYTVASILREKLVTRESLSDLMSKLLSLMNIYDTRYVVQEAPIRP